MLDRDMDVELEWETQFINPSEAYRTAPFWVWNEAVSKEMITKQLGLLRSNGFGGAFVHPRPGLLTEYLSEEWFELWTFALEEAKRLSMKLYIYDENSYPSGFAGGHVPSKLPDCLARAAVIQYHEDIDDPSTLYEDLWIPEASLKRPIRIYSFERRQGRVQLGQDLTCVPDSRWGEYGRNFVALLWQQPEYTPWLGGFAYPDLLRPEVTRLFIETTYEAYYRKFGADFGLTIPAIFSDEPTLSPGSVFIESGDALPFSYWFAAQFESLNGYSLLDQLVWLFVDPTEEVDALGGIDAKKVRYDYYSTLHRLWTDNFLKPISDWCQERNIAWTGHFMEHHWPYPWGQCSPAVMSYYEYMTWPGIDMLMSYLLKESNTDPLLLTIKEVQSAAQQLGKQRVLCEMHGAGGWETTFEDMKRMGDWLAVNGITFFNQHLTFSSIIGARKRDHPLSFDWRQPWWQEYGQLNDYFARLSYVMTHSRTLHKVLVLHPTTSWFLDKPLDAQGNMMWEWEDVPEGSAFRGYVTLLQQLSGQQIGYDLGDEFILEKHAAVADGKLQVGQCSYDVLIVPEAMRNMRQSTLDMIRMYMEGGGRVWLLGQPPERIDGARSSLAGALFVHSGGCQFITRSELQTKLHELALGGAVQVTEGDQAGVSLLRKMAQPGRELIFMVNSNAHSVRYRLELGQGSIRELHLFTGEIGAGSICTGEQGQYTAELPAYGSALLEFRQGLVQSSELAQEAGAIAALPTTEWTVTTLQHQLAERLTDNALMLDYCELTLGSEVLPNLHTLAATDRIFKFHGFSANPWDRTVQFEHRNLQQQPVNANSGFEACFVFNVLEGAVPSRCLLAVERAQSYTLFLNGIRLEWLNDRHWLDENIGLADMAYALQPGRNTIRLVAQPFHVLLELEPVYVLGDFGVKLEQQKFHIAKASDLKLGSIAAQGCPFYGGVVRYGHSVTLTKRPSHARIKLNDWRGTVCRIEVNGVKVGLLGMGTGQWLRIEDFLAEGHNLIVVEIAASLKNVLGPHHDSSKPRGKAWPAHWKIAPRIGPVAAENYDFIDYGLYEPITIQYSK